MEELSYWKFNINRKKKYEEWVGKGRRFKEGGSYEGMKTDAWNRVKRTCVFCKSGRIYLTFPFRISMLNIIYCS